MAPAEAILRGFAALIRALTNLGTVTATHASVEGALAEASRLEAEAQAIAEREQLTKGGRNA